MKYKKIAIIVAAIVFVSGGVYAFASPQFNQVKADATQPYNESFSASLTNQSMGTASSTASSTATTSSATGIGTFNVANDGQSIDYHVYVTNLSSAYMSAHLHCAAVGDNGPIVVPLTSMSSTSNSVVLHGTIMAGDIMASAAQCSPNITTLAHLVQAMREGKIYVNVHTVNFPNGEVRGQLYRNDMIVNFPGMATSTATSTTGTTGTSTATSTTGTTTTGTSGTTTSTTTNSGSGSTSTTTGSTTTSTSPSNWYYVFVKPDAYYKIQGSSVQFMGSHFMPGETVTISLPHTTVGTVTADSSGNFTSNWITVPYNLGMRTFTFMGNQSQIPFNVGINVGSGSPWIVLSTYYAGAGAPLTVTGNQFGANENVTVWFNSMNIGTATTNSEGSFTLNTTVPSAGQGQWTVTAKGATTNMTTSQSFSESR